MATSRGYNTTDLRPDWAFGRHIFHRDQFAHYLRWSYILKVAKIGETIVDFGCGYGLLFDVLYHNKYKMKAYYGLDIRKTAIEAAQERSKDVDWAHWIVADLVKIGLDFTQQFNADKVCCFEVLEHIGKQNADEFLKRFKSCGKLTATYYLSTPNYDPTVGAAAQHTFDSHDGRGVDVQEFEHDELEGILLKYFRIEKKFGTFASLKDYKDSMNDWQKKMHDALCEYYDPGLTSVMMAPMFPELSRNTLWVLKRPFKEIEEATKSNR